MAVRLKIDIDAGDRINNFTLADAIYDICRCDDILDVESVARMLLEQSVSDRRRDRERRGIEPWW